MATPFAFLNRLKDPEWMGSSVIANSEYAYSVGYSPSDNTILRGRLASTTYRIAKFNYETFAYISESTPTSDVKFGQNKFLSNGNDLVFPDADNDYVSTDGGASFNVVNHTNLPQVRTISPVSGLTYGLKNEAGTIVRIYQGLTSFTSFGPTSTAVTYKLALLNPANTAQRLIFANINTTSASIYVSTTTNLASATAFSVTGLTASAVWQDAIHLDNGQILGLLNVSTNSMRLLRGSSPYTSGNWTSTTLSPGSFSGFNFSTTKKIVANGSHVIIYNQGTFERTFLYSSNYGAIFNVVTIPITYEINGSTSTYIHNIAVTPHGFVIGMIGLLPGLVTGTRILRWNIL